MKCAQWRILYVVAAAEIHRSVYISSFLMGLYEPQDVCFLVILQKVN